MAQRSLLFVATATAVGAVPVHQLVALDPLWDDHNVTGRSLSSDTMSCASAPNPQKTLDFASNCRPGSKGCWPPLYLLGVQKAATTSIVSALYTCGMVGGGMPDSFTGALQYCPLHSPCKETLHGPIDVTSPKGREKFFHLHDISRCSQIQDPDFKATTGPCEQGRFLEATPLGIGDSPNLATLMHSIPASTASMARFVLILREPVSRMLSWYNHILATPQFADPRVPMNSFEAYYQFTAHQDGEAFHMGKYSEWMHEFYMNKHVGRKQLLVLDFMHVVTNSKQSMRQITTHFGLPKILTNMAALPEENTMDSPRKVVTLKCSTRSAVGAAYSPYNQKLYTQLKHDHATGNVPAIEPPFPGFDLSAAVPCGDHEVHMGMMSRTELSEHFARMRGRVPTEDEFTGLLLETAP